MAAATIPITADPAANRFLVDEPLALVLGMLLDQQVPMEWAFRGPFTLRERLGGKLDAREIAELNVEDFVEICREKPAIHRYPGSMGKRIWEACGHIVDEYDGDAAKIWKGVRSGEELYRRLRLIPGYGDEKARIFIAILGKRMAKTPAGWQEAAHPFGDEVPRSVADVADDDSLNAVREWKAARRASAKQPRTAKQPKNAKG